MSWVEIADLPAYKAVAKKYPDDGHVRIAVAYLENRGCRLTAAQVESLVMHVEGVSIETRMEALREKRRNRAAVKTQPHPFHQRFDEDYYAFLDHMQPELPTLEGEFIVEVDAVTSERLTYD